MRRHLNTLYITTQGAWLNKDGENVVVSVDNVERGRVPLHTIGGIIGFGRVLVSPPLLGACMGAGIAVQYLTEEGRFLARVEGRLRRGVGAQRRRHLRGARHEYLQLTPSWATPSWQAIQSGGRSAGAQLVQFG